MISSTPDILNQELEKFYNKGLSRKMKKLQTLLLVRSDTIDDVVYDFTRFRVPEMKLNELITFAVFSWYCPEELKFLIQFWLIENWSTEHREILDILLTSKEVALGYLLVQDRFNESDFFGNYVKSTVRKLTAYTKKGEKIIHLFNFLELPTGKVEKYTGYCRGYGETGTWSPHHSEKALRKPLLTLDDIIEREEIQKQKYLSLLELILTKIE